MAEWLQYLPHINCIKVAKFLGWDPGELHCAEESTDDLPFTVDDITVQPKQWLLKTRDGVVTVHDQRGNQ